MSAYPVSAGQVICHCTIRPDVDVRR